MRKVFEQLPQWLQDALGASFIQIDAQLENMSDAQLLRRPNVGKEGVQIIRALQGRAAPELAVRRPADRLWLAGIVLQGAIIGGRDLGPGEVVEIVDRLMDELDV